MAVFAFLVFLVSVNRAGKVNLKGCKGEPLKNNLLIVFSLILSIKWFVFLYSLFTLQARAEEESVLLIVLVHI